MDRNIADVLKAVIAVLTENGVDSTGLGKILARVGYVAPEMRGHLWSETEVWMTKNLPSPRAVDAPLWAVKAAEIFSGRIDSRPRFYLTVVRVAILSEGRPYGRGVPLADVAHEITEGGCVGLVTCESEVEVTKAQMEKTLAEAKADPGFFERG